MAKVGIDISHHRSKHAAEYATQPIDYVITVCDRAKESCPRWLEQFDSSIEVSIIRQPPQSPPNNADKHSGESATRSLH